MKRLFSITLFISLVLAVIVLSGAQSMTSADPANSFNAQIDIVGPAGSERFGRTVTVLSSGSIVITDPFSWLFGRTVHP
jgi:hypothetical protein